MNIEYPSTTHPEKRIIDYLERLDFLLLPYQNVKPSLHIMAVSILQNLKWSETVYYRTFTTLYCLFYNQTF